VQIEENVPLAQFTTLKIGGPARYFVRANGVRDVRGAVDLARKQGIPFFVIGGGSNLVVSDAGYPGVVIKPDQNREIYRVPNSGSPGFVRFEVDADVEWDVLVRTVCEAGLYGLECLAGIPGLVGGAPVQNIGAYGQEVSQTVGAVIVIDPDSKKRNLLLREHCEFAYRRSVFNTTLKGRYVIARVGFNLEERATPKLIYPDLIHHFGPDAKPSPIEVYHAVRRIRATKGMLIDPADSSPDARSAGSFFKNPVVPAKVLREIVETMAMEEREVPHWPASSGEVKLAAAWLIEKAGFAKGFAMGRVGISSKHTLALINRTGDASCADLLRLRDLIVLTVEQRFGVTLDQEPVLLG